MRGVWYTTGSGGGGGMLAIGVILAAVEGVAWVLAHIIWILATGLLCAALSVAAVMALMAWTDRRCARFNARLDALRVTEIPPARQPPAIGPVYNLNFYGVPEDERAAVIRSAIEGSEPRLCPRVHSRAFAC